MAANPSVSNASGQGVSHARGRTIAQPALGILIRALGALETAARVRARGRPLADHPQERDSGSEAGRLREALEYSNGYAQARDVEAAKALIAQHQADPAGAVPNATALPATRRW